MRHNLASRFVVQNNPRGSLSTRTANQLAIYAHLIVLADPLPNMRWLAIDRNAACDNELFHFAPRTNARMRKSFVQFGSNSLTSQIATQTTLHIVISTVQTGQRLLELLITERTPWSPSGHASATSRSAHPLAIAALAAPLMRTACLLLVALSPFSASARLLRLFVRCSR